MEHERTSTEPLSTHAVNRCPQSESAAGDQTLPSSETPDLTCPRCDALLVGIDTCPNPAAHRVACASPNSTLIRLHGAQLPRYPAAYPVDGNGFALLPFRRADGAVKFFPVLWRWRDVESGATLPWMIMYPVLERVDLEFVTGLAKHAFNAASANFPGRIPGRYTVACRTRDFLVDYLFGDLVVREWSRLARSAKRRRLHASCAKHCRKMHRDAS